jgi:ABC-type multidrug transport system fused ATPase/permease subunit
MDIRGTIRASLGLLSPRDRRRLVLVTLAQMSTALLDLLGVLMIGVVSALSVSVMSDASPPDIVESTLARLGLSDLDVTTLTVFLAGAAGLILISKSVINVILTRRIVKFLAVRQAVVSGRLAAGLLSQPLLEVQRRSSQETAYALTSAVSTAVSSVLAQGVVTLSETTLLAVLAIGLLAISPVVTVFTVFFFLVIALVLQKLLSGWAGRLGRTSRVLEVSSYSAIQEALRTYREVVVSNRRSVYVLRFQELRGEAALVQSDSQFLGAIPKYVFEVALVIGAGLLAASQLFTRDLTAAVAIIAVFLAAGSRIVPSMLRLQTAAISIRQAAGQAAPAFELAHDLSLWEADQGAPMPEERVEPAVIRARLEAGHSGFNADIRLTDVWLTYPGASGNALAGVSIVVPPGSSLALVGPTGAGKSTLADVILGVLTADRGSVVIGGIGPGEAISRWSGALAYVPQDVAMANGTVRENVALGLPPGAINDEWVWDALKRAHLAAFLRDSREGLDTLIGEHGMRLSGGQRQRLGVARALYTRPKLLVLDEATSALDSETEQGIALTLRELEGEVTTVTIAHRLATIRHCDLVVYMEHGRILASGTFDEVRQSSEHFDTQARLLGL